MKVLDIVKKFQTSSKTLLPRAVFMFLVFAASLIFGSSLFMGVGVSVVSLLSGAPLFGTLFFLALELLFLFCIFILQYGLFLSYLRFVRAQPVALSFLFTGFKQKRAKKFAAFFIAPFVLAFAITILPVSAWVANQMAESMPQAGDLQALAEYFSAHPEFMQKIAFHTLFFCAVLFVLYLPFAFTWHFVYDETQSGFKEILLKSVRFLRARILNFFGFEFAAHYKKLLIVITCNVAQFVLLKCFAQNQAAQGAASLVGFAGFFVTIVLCAAVILSIAFYYNEHNLQEENESPESESSN